MPDDTIVRGDVAQFEVPDWEPLQDTTTDIMASFMWMHEVRLETGERVHAYKHKMTRRYAYLTADGRAYTYTRSGRYALLPEPPAAGYDVAMWAVLEAAVWPHSHRERGGDFDEERCGPCPGEPLDEAG